MTVVNKNIKKKKLKKRGGVGCALSRNPTLGCERVDKHTESCNPKYKKLFYDLSNLFIDNSNLSSDDKNELKDKLKKHIMGNKSCDNKEYNFIIMLLNRSVNIIIKFYKNCRILLLIEYNANIHFTMFSDLNESKGYYGCCSPVHLTINKPKKTRAYISFEYTENIDSLADAIEATGCYILTNKTRTTDEPISDSWSDILMNIDEYGRTYRDTFKRFCDNLKDYIITKNPGYSDFDSVRSPDRHPRHREVARSGYMSGHPPRRSPDRHPRDRESASGRYMDAPPPTSTGRTARSRSPGRRSSDGHTGLGRSGDRRYSYGRTGRSGSPGRGSSELREGDGRYREVDSSRMRSSDMRTGHSRSGGGNLLNKKNIDSINKYFDKIKKIKQEIKILKKKKNKKKIEAKKTTIKNTLVKIKLKKEKLKKIKQKKNLSKSKKNN
jgi:hypothetical protein